MFLVRLLLRLFLRLRNGGEPEQYYYDEGCFHRKRFWMKKGTLLKVIIFPDDNIPVVRRLCCCCDMALPNPENSGLMRKRDGYAPSARNGTRTYRNASAVMLSRCWK